MSLYTHWYPMQATDLPTVVAIASEVHRDFYESPDVLADKQALYPKGAWIGWAGDRIAGYCFSHPWRYGDIPALNTLLGEIPEDADTYYLHDMALLPFARGQGMASAYAEIDRDYARTLGFDRQALVAVNNSRPFWEKQGFTVLDRPELTTKLMGYEPEARYMVRAL